MAGRLRLKDAEAFYRQKLEQFAQALLAQNRLGGPSAPPERLQRRTPVPGPVPRQKRA